MARKKKGLQKVKRGDASFKRQGGDKAWQRCNLCKEEYAFLTDGVCTECEDRKRQRAAERARLMLMVGPSVFEAHTFEKFKANGNNRAAIDVCKAFNPKTTGLYIFGPCGAGKTHLAHAIVHSLFCRGYSDNALRVVRVSGMLRSFRALTGGEESRLVREYGLVKVLVLDDLGAEKVTEFSAQIVCDILTQRADRNIGGLVITSNFRLHDLARKIGNERIASRIAGLCKPVKLFDRDHRVLSERED